MGPISLEQTIDAPRERIYEGITDLSIRPSYTDHFMHSYRLERVEPRGVGASARFRTGKFGARAWMDTAIVEGHPPQKVAEEGTTGRLNHTKVHTVWEISEGPGAVNTVRFTFWTEPANIFERLKELTTLSSGWYKRRWRKSLQRLAEVIEGDREATHVRVAGGDRAFTGVP